MKPLTEVRSEIVAAMTADAARLSATAEARQALLALREGASIETFASDNGYDWQVELGADRGNGQLPPMVLRRAFELPAPAEGVTTFEFVPGLAGDIQVLELVRVTPGDASQLAAERKTNLGEQLSSEYGSLLLDEYQRGLRANAEISVL